MSATIMIRLSSVLTLMVLFANPALAQKLSFGPIGGVTFSTWRGADATPTPDFLTGFFGGGFVTHSIHKQLALEAQVLYVRKGMELTTTFCPVFRVCEPLTVSWTQDFIEVPLLFTVAAPTRFAPTLFAGPAVAFQTSCTFRSSGPLSSASCDSALAPTGPGAPPPVSMSHTDALLVFGGGFHLGQLALVARYDLGLTKFLHRQATYFDQKTRAWLIGASLDLSRGRR